MVCLLDDLMDKSAMCEDMKIVLNELVLKVETEYDNMMISYLPTLILVHLVQI